jgi:amino acid adenylation domain-containing protein/non-ribosomal peptide synthase protein (TIGR01720 family)
MSTSPTKPTRQELIDRLLKAKGIAVPRSQAIPRRERGDETPVSFAQQRLWFLDRLEPGTPAYNLAGAVRLRGRLDVGLLERAMTEIVRRHESLRTTFAAAGDTPRQVVHEPADVALPVVDLAPAASKDEASAVRAAVTAEARAPFDLERGPLLRAKLLRLGEADHVLAFAVHHIVSDAWSLGVLVRELGALYEAYAADKPSPLDELPIQYADYARWQRQPEGAEGVESQVAYWRERLAGAPAALDLPADRPRPPRQTYDGDVVRRSLSPELSARFRELCRAEGVTLFAGLLSAFDVLLWRYTGVEDLVVGSPVAGRARPEVEGLIGFFVNTLVLRTDLSGEPTFRELCARQKEVALSAFSHADVPFERLVEELRPTRDPSRPPLFQVAFALENVGVPDLRLPGLSLSTVGASSRTAKFDLMLTVVEGPERLDCEIELNTALFDRERMERALAHYERLLARAVEEPGRSIRELAALSDGERRLVVDAWNDTAKDYGPAACLHHLFEAQVDRTPDAIALEAEGERVSYRELDARANRLAHRLRRAGVGRDALVAVCLERSIAMVVALYGVLKAGGAYVPIDPDQPAARLELFLDDAGAGVLLTDRRIGATLPAHGGEVLNLDDPADAGAGEPATRPSVDVLPADLAYMIYTSGSTGRPKGAMNTHAGIVNRLRWMQEAFPLDASDCVLQKTPYSFDVSVWELFWPLETGARLAIARPDGHKDPAYLVDAIVRHGVTTIHFVPSMLEAFLRDPGLSRATSLRRVVASGEALTPALVADLHAKLGAELENMYGPTEAAVEVSWWHCRRGEARASIPIGRPIANTRLYVLDERLEPVPVGVAGELHIGGVQVGRGYWKRPELTAERFVASPFVAGDRLYKTGDLARFAADGTIEYLGRIDHQVKIRGLRVELGEIEAALAAHPAVRAAVVALREDTPGDKRLAAYVVAGEAAPTAAELRAFLKERLPEHMVPAAFVAMDALPLTPSGKVDRKVLPAPEGGSAVATEHVAPRDALEELLAELWADVVRAPRVGVNDDFFALGGHSLLATQLVARASRLVGVDVPLRGLFDEPTVAGMAARVREARAQGSSRRVPPLAGVPRGGPLPLSFGQERLWFLFQLEPESAFYNIPLGLRLEGALDATALRGALEDLTARHEVLRTTYASSGGKPSALVHETMALELATIDLSALPEGERRAAVRAEATADLERPFDLSRGPVARWKLVRLGHDDHVLLVTLHHMVVDAWTTGLLSRDVAALYEGRVRGEAAKLPALTVQYADYAAWQRAYLTDATLDEELAYWTGALAGAPMTLDLPTDRPRPAVQTFRGSHAAKRFSPELAATLRDLCKREGVTPYMAALALFNVLLYRYTGQDDILVGTSRADRRHPETQGLVGYFLNQLVLRTRLDGEPSFRELCARVRETTLAAYAHQDLPFERLVAALRPERDLSRSPVFQVMVDSMTLPELAELPGLRVSPLAAEVETSRFDLTLALAETGGGFVASLEYNADLFDHATVERLLGHFEQLLRSAAAAPEASIAELDLLAPAERSTILDTWNATAADYATDRCIHHLIEEQVARTPDATAVYFEGTTLTYRELDERANKVARYLQGLGAGPEVRVAVCVERSIEMVVGVLGVLKAGAAYVPMDPAWPADRLAFMLEDSLAPLLLTQEAIADLLPAVYVQVISLDADWAVIDGESGEPVASEASGESLAYVIYTSGSTGRPKGVLVAHRNLVHSTSARFVYYEDKVASFLLLSSFAFDSSMAGIYWTLCQGGSITLPRDGSVEDPSQLAGLIRDARVSHLLCVPSLYTFLLAQAKDEDLASLRAVMVAGEAVPVDTVRRHHERFPDKILYNEYGPTEATVWCTVYRTKADEAGPRVSIGGPIANTQIYVLDRRDAPVPIGVPGQLHVGGLGLSRGYLNRPELDAEKFVASPFEAGKKLYRTGDLARWRADGSLDFLGRIDHQVKLRGYRIELEEIEAALLTHRGVLESVVILREDVPGDQRLVAYLVPSDTQAPGPVELREHLGASLPAYMVPSAFVALEAMPLLPNGKIDRKALPAPEARAGVGEALVAPRSPVEDVLAGIWADVLGAPRVGVLDDFFELGGHSLLATQVMARIVEAFQVEVPLARLFDAPTVAALADVVEAAVREGQGLTRTPLSAAPPGAEKPLSFGQERLWVLDQIEPNNPFYNLPGAVRLTGPLDVEALAAALRAIGERHEVLRTSFASDGERPRAVVHDDVTFELSREDLSHVAADDRDAAVLARAGEIAAQPFDLAVAPLARAALLRLSDDEHALVFSMHHAIADGWSMGVVVRELGALYRAHAEGGDAGLPALPIAYTDYARWQREWMSGEVLERELTYWKRALEGAPTTLDLPTDRPRPPVISYRGARASIRFPEGLGEAVSELCKKESVTLYMLALAGFGALLHRYSGQDDVLIGTSVADRKRAETEGLVGYFLNQLVFRVDMRGEPTFRELLRRVRETSLAAYAHQDLPFERLVEHLRVAPDMSRAPLFQVMVDVPNAPAKPLELAGVTLEAIEPPSHTARFDLTLSVSLGRDGLRGSLEYSTDLFDASTIERMTAHLGALLASAAAAPDRRLFELDLFAPGERDATLAMGLGPEAPLPEVAAHRLFEAQAAATPDAIALSFEGETMTYRELDESSSRLARHLQALGVGPDVLVGLSLRRSPSLVVGLFGILKAGGAYVPLDPSYPLERLEWMLEDSAVPVVVTEEAIAGELPALSAVLVCLDTDAETLASYEAGPLEGGAGPGDLAYVIYTSGSTGRPKGAMIEHRGLVNYLLWAKDAYRAASGAGAPVHSSVSFDLTVTGLYLPLLAGKRVDLVPEGDDAAALARALRERPGYSLVKLTPAHLDVLAAELRGAEARGATGVFVIGGEALSWDKMAFWRESAPGTRLVNEYGPTETVVGCSVYDAAEGPLGLGSVPIGRAIANTRLHVLDGRLSPVPAGVPGELYIGGAGLARGYWSRPELTAERFVADPFRPGERLYKTGDLARFRPDGELEFLGRLDTQVKVRGYRIELGEIEAALRRHAGVGDVVAIAREDAPGDRRLVAYVVPAADGAPDAAELRAFLAARLPDYMVPSAFVTLASIPLTSNGKVDRRALPAPDARAGLAERVAPRDAVEEALASIWSEVLGVAELGVNDGFFELGGHSLVATRVLARVRSSLGVDLPFRTMFEAPTIAALAERVRAKQGDGAPAAADDAIARVPRTGALPLSFAQERLWFLHQLEPDSAAYNVPEVVRLEGALDAGALAAALAEVVRRHEVLRTVYPTIEGRARALVRDFALDLPVTDLSGLPPAGREAAMKLAVSEEASRPFRLAEGPLVRARLLRLHAEEHVLLYTTHHIVSDAWSVRVLLDEVGALYGARRAGAPSPLAQLPIQYADYAAWQRGRATEAALAEQLAYWRATLEGLKPLELPADRPRPPEQTFSGARVSFRVGRAVTARLEELAKRESATLFMALAAAFQLLLARHSGQDDVAIGTPVENRGRVEAEGLIGLFLNTLVLRTDLSGAPTFRELLGRARDAALGAFAHRDLPFERLVDALAPERDMSRTPLFQVMFILQPGGEAGAALQGLRLSRVSSDDVTAKFDLTLAMGEAEGGLVGAFELNTDLFDVATIERLRDSFLSILETIAADPEKRTTDVDVIGEAGRRALLVDWNATAERYRDAPVDALFVEQVARRPDAIAVSSGDERVTYAELDRRASRLARHLAARGVGPGDRVGLCVGRSVRMVVALLAIQRVGAAYVPLDPDYPADRLVYILGDARARLLVTEGRLGELFPAFEGALVSLDRDAAAIEAESDAPLASRAAPSGLAYAIYTSGSTGQPKGVLIGHRALTNFVLSMVKAPGVSEADVLVAVTSLSFDIAGLELYCPLAVGARVDVVSREVAADGERLAARLDEVGATLFQATPATYRVLLEAGFRGKADLTMLCGGEALPRALADALLDKGRALWNMFGPTETTIWSAIHRVEAGAGPVPIGRPIANTQLYVLDARRSLVPVGASGELYIGGDGLADGYLGRPELTAERFVPSPFAPGKLLYRTGDLARWLPSGEVELLGRLDHQIKIRGFRVELGEIEAALAKHPSVKQVVVVAREDAPGQKRLVAYVVPGEGEPLTTQAARAFLKASLPDYMVPSAVVALERLPLTPNGKIDRRALPAPAHERAEPAPALPRTRVEELLAETFRDVLRLADVSIHDNFFELGGDSILGIQVVSRARDRGLSITPRQVFLHQTVAELAAVAGTVAGGAADEGPSSGPLPLLPAQHFWLAQEPVEPDHDNQAILLEAKNGLDPAALERAIEAVVRHHDALRLRVARVDGRWAQAVAAEQTGSLLRWVDVAGLPEGDAMGAMRAAAEDAQRSLSLASGPVLRLVGFDAGPARPAKLLVVVHHVAIDRVSWGILLEDLARAYGAAAEGRAPELPRKTTSLRRWAIGLVEHASSERAAAELPHWTSPARAAAPRLPLDPRGDATVAGARTVTVALAADRTTALLRDAQRAYRTGVPDLLAAALLAASRALTGGRSLLVALEGHGREDVLEGVDLSRTIGWLTAIVPVLLEAPEGGGPGALVKAVKEQLRLAPNGGMGHGLLAYLREGREAEALRAAPGPEVSLNYLGQVDGAAAHDAPFRPTKGPVGAVQSPAARRRFPLEVAAVVQDGELRVHWTYGDGQLERAAVEGAARAFVHELEALIEHCLSPEAGGYTPSDFTKARIDQATLDRLAAMDDDEEGDDEDEG